MTISRANDFHWENGHLVFHGRVPEYLTFGDYIYEYKYWYPKQYPMEWNGKIINTSTV